jgi:hypothetical protein
MRHAIGVVSLNCAVIICAYISGFTIGISPNPDALQLAVRIHQLKSGN